ncbi:MAG: competence protein CoiA family protein, partial [Ignavibacteria bacterium]|nr:competence protein CoiA family protein [Ignavibacteria bacterium]
MAKYSYALSDLDDLIHVGEIEKEKRHIHKYYCLGCGQEMIPRLGVKRMKHFAHKVEDNSTSCSFESYLHHAAKILLYESIKQKISKNKPLYLNYSYETHCAVCHFPEEGFENCLLSGDIGKYNLLIHYKIVQLEKIVD